MRCLRVEVYPNPLNANYAGDYLVPVWEADDGKITVGSPMYLHSPDAVRRMPADARLAALALVDADKRFGSILRAFFEANR